ncbi:MAG: DUF3280 domain-containing protein [Geminicoccaceae bacterium]|nr:DUF3280 domain-containing protein [Geminicoccaceae bacterium]MCX7630953.1 DUF3280 domain-containing protein [Geminicoccaceae bacterium]MDW8125084.1 DUF3280 domain-containing protein [Geminicoccaceae bacterium]
MSFVAIPLLLALFAAPAAGAEGTRLVLFPLEFVNTSLEPLREDERARIRLAEAELRRLLGAKGYVLVDFGPVAAKTAAYASLRECGGCELDFARELGAREAALAWVGKTSNLILDITLRIADVETGKLVRKGSVSIRGNTDESWLRGLRFLIENVVFAPRS